ncbi:HAD family hydrolase [Cyanothece sp. BG0011]|uniref:HAD-IIB family hydrolase n=1 Tax=Cyanothece sp. BG0011 TaxID=2082950 RepID=UPI000D1F5906|nr:HAD family hydrolase [Cyanothece sp. BG0011]
MLLTKLTKELVTNQFKKIKLIATDIDGTLTKKGEFSSQLLSTLEQLQKHKIQVILITGRSAGWCQGIVNYLPVWGIIAENGGVYCLKNNQQITPLTAVDNVVKHRQSLQDNFEYLKSQFPHLVTSSDNQFRITDWTFDCHELSQEELLNIKKICDKNNWGFTYSHIQGHLKPVEQDKAKALISLKENYFKHLSLQEIMTVGDSPNDESLFNLDIFPVSVGVNNLLKYTEKLQHKPVYLTNLSEIDGFCELAKLLI